MPNLAQVLKDEIRRLARKEIRSATSGLKSDNVTLKKTVAKLKRQVATLEKQVSLLRAAEKRLRDRALKSKIETGGVGAGRFSPKGIRALRQRLGLTQAEFAILVEVTPQAVYVWENKEGRLNLRDESLAKLEEIRGIGAREARRRIEDAA